VITGTEFTGASAVTFGGIAATKYTVNSSGSITATAPPQAAGTVDVLVTNIEGTSAATSKDHYKYTPIVETIAPSTGSTAGGTTVTVSGTGFAPGATQFKFGKTKATSVSCTSSTSCTIVSPSHLAGTVDVRATVAKATSPINRPGDQFTYG
jgi:hypothetical protein